MFFLKEAWHTSLILYRVIIGSVILITVFVVNILLSSDFQNEMKEFNTHYDTYIDENDDSI